MSMQSMLALSYSPLSFSVTAGVLRGDKSRFQLFGDTVNTGKAWLIAPPKDCECARLLIIDTLDTLSF